MLCCPLLTNPRSCSLAGRPEPLPLASPGAGAGGHSGPTPALPPSPFPILSFLFSRIGIRRKKETAPFRRKTCSGGSSFFLRSLCISFKNIEVSCSGLHTSLMTKITWTIFKCTDYQASLLEILGQEVRVGSPGICF